ncbi:MAG: ABC transporter permease [Spirochaetota bacterium]
MSDHTPRDAGQRGVPRPVTNLRKAFQRKETPIAGAAVVLFVVFAISSDSFLTPFNIFNVSRNLSFNIFIALGQTFALVVGGLNLSVGAIGGLSTVTVGLMVSTLGLPSWLAVITALAVGLLAGFINGILITKLKLNSFIVTLSTTFIFTGLVYGISRGYPYTDIPEQFSYFGRQSLLFFPAVFWLMIAALIAVWYFFAKTVTGRRMLATGSNETAARLSGINTDRIIVTANVIGALWAALTGILYVSRMGTAQPATGQNWLIISFAVAIIGGTALRGGFVSSIGLFAGGIILVLIKNGLVLLEANVYFEQAFLGVIILLAVSLESIQMVIGAGRRRKKSTGGAR